MENTLTSSELKRRGIAAVESALEAGPVHLYKRNRRTAVVLAEADYQRLLAQSRRRQPGMSALDWLLAHPPNGKRGKRSIDQRLRAERDW